MRNIRKSIRNLNRYKEILVVLVKFGFWDIVAKIQSELVPDIAKKIMPSLEKKELALLGMPIRLRMVFDELGSTFIKLGQMLSIRPDLIPPDFAQEFSKLQDNISPLPFEEFEKYLNKELNNTYSDIFAEYNKIPLAAASMAQVHSAKLMTGEDVAVKILRPNIKLQIESDIDILLNLASLIEKYIPESKLYDPVGIVREFEKTIIKEQNLIWEGRNIDVFRRYNANEKTINVPIVYWEYTSEKVLVTELIKGIKISDITALDNSGIDRKQVAENGANSILKQIFEFGFFHADPHPGNIFVLPDNVIAFIDFGMMGRIDEEMKDNLLDILHAVTEKDVFKITRILLRIGLVEDQIDSGALQRDLLDLIYRYYGIPLNQIDTAMPLNEFMNLIREHQIKLPPDLTMMGKAIVMSESVGVQLHPEFNLFDLLEPYAKGLFFKRFNPQYQSRHILRITEQISDLLKSLPEDFQNLLLKIKNDKISLNIEHKGLEDFKREIDRSGNRLSFSMVIASLIIGSSFIIQIDKGPMIFDFPAIGLIGYLLASVLGLWLLFGIIRSGKL